MCQKYVTKKENETIIIWKEKSLAMKCVFRVYYTMYGSLEEEKKE